MKKQYFVCVRSSKHIVRTSVSVRGNAPGDNPFPGLAKSGQISKHSAEAG